MVVVKKCTFFKLNCVLCLTVSQFWDTRVDPKHSVRYVVFTIASCQPGREGGCSPIQVIRAWFLSCFGLKWGNDFDFIDLKV